MCRDFLHCFLSRSQVLISVECLTEVMNNDSFSYAIFIVQYHKTMKIPLILCQPISNLSAPIWTSHHHILDIRTAILKGKLILYPKQNSVIFKKKRVSKV